MKQLRPIARVIIMHEQRIMLVRNRGAHFWYPPGGGWEYADETIAECARREVKEETNYDVDIERMLWLGEFRENDNVYLETFWLGRLRPGSDLSAHTNHADRDPNGAVTEVRWFTESELADLTVFPESIKTFSKIDLSGQNPYLG
ncbi:MAG TPA: NUDIX hydrolase [Candidatus Saccharimonas sp.]|nr:NUDIX hydrolase [Candidatus Saccharimonas sp.]